MTKNKRLILLFIALFAVLGILIFVLAKPELPDKETLTFKLRQIIKGNITRIDSCFSKDKFYVYHNQGIGDHDYDEGYPYRKINKADPGTFKSLPTKSNAGCFGKDSNYVFYSLSQFPVFSPIILENAHALSFEIVGESVYAKDNNRVYLLRWRGIKEIPNADPNTFTALGYAAATDKNHAYLWENIIPNVDPRYFTKHDTGYYYDSQNDVLYKSTNKFQKVDIDTFEIMQKVTSSGEKKYSIYARDKNNIYCVGQTDFFVLEDAQVISEEPELIIKHSQECRDYK